MDLSIGGDLSKIRKTLISECPLPFGTVPIYQAAKDCGGAEKMSLSAMLEAIKEHAEDGVDFMTIHCGISIDMLELTKCRKMPIVSRGGHILAKWMKKNKEENPLYTEFSEILKIAKEHNVTLSLGDSLRPGCLSDATDEAQIAELLRLGELVKEARKEGVSVMVEGPGHLPLHHIEANVRLAKRLTLNAPLYLLGPLPCDIAPGYDHISSAIGGALAAWVGADFLCYVTPSEHLGLPEPKDVREGVIAARIAAHCADVAKGLDRKEDEEMAVARKSLDWKKQAELSIDPDIRFPKEGEPCTMCGDWCVFRDESSKGCI
jgi:phosphomethylpyrimidine synthase